MMVCLLSTTTVVFAVRFDVVGPTCSGLRPAATVGWIAEISSKIFQSDLIPLADLRGEAQGNADVFALNGGQCAHSALTRGRDKGDIAGHNDLCFLVVGREQVWRRQHIDIVLALNGLDQRTDIEELLPAKGDRAADEANRQTAEREWNLCQIVDQSKAFSTKHHRALRW